MISQWVNHISLSPVISQRVIHQQSIQRLFATVVRVSFGIASSSIHWIQLEPTDQPAAFTLSILADQGAVSAQFLFLYLPPSLPSSIPIIPLFLFFSLPISDVTFVRGLKNQTGCIIQPDRLEVRCRAKRGHVRLTCSLLSAHALCKGEFKG